ncbi:MAG: HRDC domain-containing protein [Pseudomonadota bacterium]
MAAAGGSDHVRMRFFTVPLYGGEAAAEAFNRFLAGHRIIAIDKEFVQDGRGSAWALSVSYDDAGERPPPARRAGKVDYKEILNNREFAVYARLRDLRKDLADKEGIPAYALFNNEQLAAMVQGRVTSGSALSNISGVGAARVEKYGEAFLAVLRDSVNSLNDAQDKGRADAQK